MEEKKIDNLGIYDQKSENVYYDLAYVKKNIHLKAIIYYI